MNNHMPRLGGPDDQVNDRQQEPLHGESSQKSKRGIPTRDEILAAIAQVGILVTLGIMAPSRANSAVKAFETLLKYQQTATGQTGHDNLDVVELRRAFRDHQQLADTLAPFLNPEVLDQLLRGEEHGK